MKWLRGAREQPVAGATPRETTPLGAEDVPAKIESDQPAPGLKFEDTTPSSPFPTPKPNSALGGGFKSCVPEDTFLLEPVVHPMSSDLPLVTTFPKAADSSLAVFDDYLISMIQSPLRGDGLLRHAVVFAARFVSAVFTFEFSFSIPILLLLLQQYDNLAVLYTYEILLMSLLTHLPRRFLFRARPYVHDPPRGERVSYFTPEHFYREGPEASSFPAKTVVASTVLGCLLCTTWEMQRDHMLGIPWGPSSAFSWLVISVVIIGTCWSTILLGSHYPSCCVSGIILGLITYVCGLSIARIHFYECGCHLHLEEEDDTMLRDEPMPSVVIALLIPSMILLVVALGLKPLVAWGQCTHALALLLPALTFEMAFLCPNLSGGHGLNVKHEIRPSTTTILTATGLTTALTITGFATRANSSVIASGPIQFSCFISLFVFATMALVGTRMVQEEYDSGDWKSSSGWDPS